MPAVAIAAPAAASASPAATATATPAAAATAVPAATPSRLTFSGLVDGQGAAVERLAIELGNGGLRILVVCELDEGKPARLTRHAVGDDADADDFTAAGGTSLAERGFVRVIRKISYVNASSHASPLPVRFGYR